MRTTIIGGPTGVEEAAFGLGLSYGLTSNMAIEDFMHSAQFAKCMNVMTKLSHQQGGHNKFLESIVMWLDITAPRFWWQEFDTYRVGVTKQSESTIHTIKSRPLEQADFEYQLPDEVLDVFNLNLPSMELPAIKNQLPEGFLQRRIVCINLKTLQNMWYQRKNHKLPQWHTFFDDLNKGLSNSWYETSVRYWIFKNEKDKYIDVESDENSFN